MVVVGYVGVWLWLYDIFVWFVIVLIGFGGWFG